MKTIYFVILLENIVVTESQTYAVMTHYMQVLDAGYTASVIVVISAVVVPIMYSSKHRL